MNNASEVRRRILHALIPAVPVPFGASGEIDRTAQEQYVAWMSGQPAAGVAVWAHTGRGVLLNREQRLQVLESWSRGLGREKLMIAGVGGAPGLANNARAFLQSALEMAHDAAEGGAQAVLVHPPGPFRGIANPRPALDQLNEPELSILDYHNQLSHAGLPLILFYLYEAAGGISYSVALLRRLLAIPAVVGIKLATLDSVMTFQSVANLVRCEFPEKVVITGEDRFLGYSLMCGAQAALIGMGAASTGLQYQLLRSYFDAKAASFLTLSAQVDKLSQALFVPPMEGYIRRMLWTLVHQGVLDRRSACDPWGPDLPESEFAAIRTRLEEIGEPQKCIEP